MLESTLAPEESSSSRAHEDERDQAVHVIVLFFQSWGLLVAATVDNLLFANYLTKAYLILAVVGSLCLLLLSADHKIIGPCS